MTFGVGRINFKKVVLANAEEFRGAESGVRRPCTCASESLRFGNLGEEGEGRKRLKRTLKARFSAKTAPRWLAKEKKDQKEKKKALSGDSKAVPLDNSYSPLATPITHY